MSQAIALSRFDHAIVLMLDGVEESLSHPLPVSSTLARGFAQCTAGSGTTPDHPFSHRARFHTGTTSEPVSDEPVTKWLSNHHDTLFNRLEAKGITWAVYYDERDVFPLTLLLHFPRLWPYFRTHFHAIDRFFHDAERGTLPSYALIEPSRFVGRDPRALICDVYEAVRGSQTKHGSNFSNTLLTIYSAAGERVAPVVVSGWTSPGRVIRAALRPASMLKTLGMKWGLEPLTPETAAAPDLLEVFDRPVLRARAQWPVLAAPERTPASRSAADLDRPLDPLQHAILTIAHAIDTGVRGSLPKNPEVGTALAHLRAKMAELQVF